MTTMTTMTLTTMIARFVGVTVGLMDMKVILCGLSLGNWNSVRHVVDQAEQKIRQFGERKINLEM